VKDQVQHPHKTGSQISFQAFMVVMFQVVVFWVTPCIQNFRGIHWKQHGPLKRWYPTTTLHGITTHKNST